MNYTSTLYQKSTRLWLGRGMIAVVVFLNIQAAILFLLHPARFAPSFELTGVPGTSIIQGIGLLFIMWNVPYFVALLDPHKHRTSITEAVVMQAIGVIGEAILRGLIPSGHALIYSSTSRFIWFDSGGLLLLVLAWLITRETQIKE